MPKRADTHRLKNIAPKFLLSIQEIVEMEEELAKATG